MTYATTTPPTTVLLAALGSYSRQALPRAPTGRTRVRRSFLQAPTSGRVPLPVEDKRETEAIRSLPVLAIEDGAADTMSDKWRRLRERRSRRPSHLPVLGPSISPRKLATCLPMYSTIIGRSGTSTTWLLSRLAAALAEADADPTIVVLDPKGDAAFMVDRASSQATVTVLSCARATLADGLARLGSSPPGSAILIDCAMGLNGTGEERNELAWCIRALRPRKHRVVIQAHLPEHLPEVPPPELFCTFPLLQDSAQMWAEAHPVLEQSGALEWQGHRSGGLGRCIVTTDKCELLGTVDVGREPRPVCP